MKTPKWYHVLTAIFFLACVGLLVHAFTLMVPVYVVTMAAMSAISGYMVYRDFKSLRA